MARVLTWLCSPKGITRLQPLLGVGGPEAADGGGSGGAAFDAVSALLVAVLDHFTAHFSDQPTRILTLLPLEQQLCRLIEEAHPHAGSSAHHFGVNGADGNGEAAMCAREDVQARAARVLVRLWHCKGAGSSDPAREPLALEACGGRARALEILTRHAERCHAEAAARLAVAKQNGDEQVQLVESEGLIAQPCIAQERLNSFSEQLGELSHRRHALGEEVHVARQAADAILASLDQRGVKHGVFKAEVCRLEEEIETQAVEEARAREAHAVACEHEAVVQEAQAMVERCRAERAAAEACSKETATRAKEAEARAIALDGRRAELAEILHSAPGGLERLRGRAGELGARREGVREKLRQLAMEVAAGERHVEGLRGSEGEADAALQSIAVVKAELETLKASLNNELFLSKEEVDKLIQLETQLQPARPSRLRRSSGGSAEEVAAPAEALARSTSAGSESRSPSLAAAEADSPVWDGDVRLEREFRETPQFRAFAALHEQRSKLWHSERRWLQDVAGRAEGQGGRLKFEMQELQRQDRALQDEEDNLQRELRLLDDPAGHAARHAEAAEVADGARHRAQEAATEAGEALAGLRSIELRLAQEEQMAQKAQAELDTARRAADAELEQCLRARGVLERHCFGLQDSARAQLHQWQVLELQEQRVELLQVRVREQMLKEADGRSALRDEVWRLMEELQNLDRQLEGQPVALPKFLGQAGRLDSDLSCPAQEDLRGRGGSDPDVALGGAVNGSPGGGPRGRAGSSMGSGHSAAAPDSFYSLAPPHQ